MLTLSVQYKFQSYNITAEFILQKDEKNPIAKVIWSKDINTLPNNRKNSLQREYFEKTVPFIFQQAANFIGQTILWVDKYGKIPPKRFEPQISRN